MSDRSHPKKRLMAIPPFFLVFQVERKIVMTALTTALGKLKESNQKLFVMCYLEFWLISLICHFHFDSFFKKIFQKKTSRVLLMSIIRYECPFAFFIYFVSFLRFTFVMLFNIQLLIIIGSFMVCFMNGVDKGLFIPSHPLTCISIT